MYSQPSLWTMFSETQAAYLAGLIDAEGCFRIVPHSNGSACARLIIGMTGNAVPMLQAEFGFGRIDKRTGNTKHKDCLIWTVGSKDCRIILPIILPFLRFKAAQARLVLKFLAIRKTSKNRLPTRERVMDIFYEIRKLNKRGRLDFFPPENVVTNTSSPAFISETQKAYLAGMIDGDGWITIYKARLPSDKSKDRYIAACGIGYTDRQLATLQNEI